MEDLISKKEVLEKYSISYGALYRWKRMGLIPEAWFIRKSTSTGQETFSRPDGTPLEKLAAELAGQQQQRRSARRLILEDRFGRRDFNVEEIRQACLTDGEQETSILEFLKEAPL